MPLRLCHWLLATTRGIPLEAWAITLIYVAAIINGFRAAMFLGD